MPPPVADVPLVLVTAVHSPTDQRRIRAAAPHVHVEFVESADAPPDLLA
jgi:hypothetical protein